MYEVLEVKGKPGLTVGSNVLKPGQKFSREDWNWPEENLKACIETKRCKKIFVSEKTDDKKKKSGDDK